MPSILVAGRVALGPGPGHLSNLLRTALCILYSVRFKTSIKLINVLPRFGGRYRFPKSQGTPDSGMAHPTKTPPRTPRATLSSFWSPNQLPINNPEFDIIRGINFITPVTGRNLRLAKCPQRRFSNYRVQTCAPPGDPHSRAVDPGPGLRGRLRRKAYRGKEATEISLAQAASCNTTHACCRYFTWFSVLPLQEDSGSEASARRRRVTLRSLASFVPPVQAKLSRGGRPTTTVEDGIAARIAAP